MTLDGLVTINANLADGYNQLDPKTFQTSSEWTTDRRTVLDLRDRWAYTANGSVYEVENGEAILYFGQRDAFNAVFGKNIKKATRQLIETKNYSPNKKEVEVAKSLEDTLRIKISDLELKGDDKEWGYFEIDTKEYDTTLNQSQRRLAEAVYGKGDDFIEAMQMLNADRISVTKIYALREDYVKQHAKESPVARAGRLGGFGSNSLFVAIERIVDYHYALRGVLKNVA